MEVYDDSFPGLWRLLNENQVRFMMVRGFATNFHGYQRFTGDIDIFIDDSILNRQRIRKAFKELNMGRL